MDRPHMCIYASPRISVTKCLHTYPANMCTTAGAMHMVTTSILLQIGLASWTSSDAIFLLPSSEVVDPATQVISICNTVQTFVKLDVTRSANAIEARWATKDRLGGLIHHPTIRCRAVLELGRSGVDVCQEGRFVEPAFDIGGQHIPNEDVRDWSVARFAVILINAFRRRDGRICSCLEQMLQTISAVAVAARKVGLICDIAIANRTCDICRGIVARHLSM